MDERAAALTPAMEIGASAPLSLAAMRRRLVAEVHAALEAEADAQAALLGTADFRGGSVHRSSVVRPTSAAVDLTAAALLGDAGG
jgi:hypothetical protein